MSHNKSTPTSGPQLSIILPAYREAENLRELLPQLMPVAMSLDPHAEVLVIEAASPVDDTAKVCADHGARCISRLGGNYYGDAVRTGINASKGQFAIIMDADGSHDSEFIRALWEKRGHDSVTIASRYVAEGSTDNPFILVELSRILNFCFKVVLKMPVFDVSNSFRIYPGDVLRSLKLEYTHFDIQEEILAKLIWNKAYALKIQEIPFRFQRRIHGHSKRSLIVFGFAFVRAMLLLFRMKRKHLKSIGSKK